jgi:molybdate transport system substrate-binding protein
LACVLALTVATAGCGGDDRDADSGVTVYAAASLTNPFTAIAEAFKRAHAEVDVVTNFAGSSELVAQISNGAPADVFAAADTATMARLVEAGLLLGDPQVFATNSMTIVVEHGNPLGIARVADLADPGTVLVVCALEVPCGAYAAEVFEQAGVAAAPDSYEENVKAVLTKVALGEADAGLVYATDVTAAGEGAVTGVAIPSDINVVAEYPIAVTTATTARAAALAFVEFVAGPEGQAILAEYGFGAP